jgi:hypothetical protein
VLRFTADVGLHNGSLAHRHAGLHADRFVAHFDDAVRAGRYTYAVTFFLTAGTLPSSD